MNDSINSYEAHVGTGHRFTDRFGITAIALVAFDIGLYKLGADQLDCVPQLLQLPRPVPRTTTGFHANHTGWKLRDRYSQLAPGHALLHHYMSVLIDPMELEDLLC